jgi:putative nucleotidyltransferase with HDIG domain
MERVEFKPNFVPDETATRNARIDAAQSVEPVLVTIRSNQKIVGEGEVVTGEHIKILRALGYQRTTSPWATITGIVFFVILVCFLVMKYLSQYRNDLYTKEHSMYLLSLLVFLTLLLTKLIVTVTISPRPEIAELVGYLVPIATGSMLIAILLDAKLAVFLTAIFSLVVGIFTNNQVPYAVNAFIGGLVGVYSVGKFSQRLEWVKAGLFISLANIITILSLGLIGNVSLTALLIGSSLGVINGLFSAITASGSLPFLESGFKLTTSVRLLELSNPNQPLLKRLMIEASGTYHHSILVGNLGEAAADAIGADSLLVRVGAYYHDIGKLKRPYFFIENQLGGDNPHEKLSPALSTLIISSHVKDGLEVARQYGLPPVITDLIAQHHGTSLITYFYHKALETGNADTVNEKDFRYKGPKPQTREAAIIMLADNVEAAVRSMAAPTSGKIEGLVRKIVKERLLDGQLDESDLTFKDVDRIISSFIHVLNGIFHSRIEYPDNVLDDVEGGNLLDASPGGKPAEPGTSSPGNKGIGV